MVLYENLSKTAEVDRSYTRHVDTTETSVDSSRKWKVVDGFAHCSSLVGSLGDSSNKWAMIKGHSKRIPMNQPTDLMEYNNRFEHCSSGVVFWGGIPMDTGIPQTQVDVRLQLRDPEGHRLGASIINPSVLIQDDSQQGVWIKQKNTYNPCISLYFDEIISLWVYHYMIILL